MKGPKGITHSEQLKTIILLMMLTSVILIVVAVVGSFWVNDIVSKKAIQEYSDKLTGAAEHIESDIDNYRSLADQYSNATWVKKIAYMQGGAVDSSRVNVMDLEDYREIIKLQCSFSNAHEICLAFFEKNLALGASTRCSLNYMVNNYLHIDAMTVDDWISFASTASVNTIAVLPDVRISRFGTGSDAMLLAFPVNPPSTKNTAALFVVIRHRDFVDTYFSDILKMSGDLQLAVRKSGDSSPFLVSGNEPSSQTIAVSADLREMGITIDMVFPGRIVLKEVVAVRNLLLLLVLLLWLVSAVLSCLISKRLFTPIRNLLNQLENNDAFRQELGEYEALENGISQLIERETAMRQELSVRQIMLRNAQIERLLGGVSLPQEELVHMCGFDGHPLYCVCLLLWEAEASKMPLPNQVEEELQREAENGNYEGIVFRRPSYSILVIGYSDHEALEEAIVALLHRWSSLYIAIGTEETSLSNLSGSLAQARKARDYRCVAEGYRVLRLDNISKNVSYYLPQEQENVMMRFISCGQEDRAAAVFDHLYQANMTDSSTTEKGMQNFLFNINFSMMKLLSPDSGIDVMEKVNREEAITVLHDVTRENIGLVSKWCRQKWMAKSARMENLLSYVDANLTESTLSLDMVAGYFGISPSLVSRLFAEQHGERFHDYVNKQRVQKSLDMLTSTENKTDISEIAARLGYTSDATFRRLFKKYMGVSPSEYRSSMLEI